MTKQGRAVVFGSIIMQGIAMCSITSAICLRTKSRNADALQLSSQGKTMLES